jgi:hypothetical protein
MRIPVVLAASTAIAVIASAAPPCGAQSRATASAFTLTAAESTRIAARVLADDRVRNLVGSKPRVYVGAPTYDKPQAAAASAAAAARRVSVLLYDPASNRAARATIGPNGTVTSVDQIPPTEVGIQPEDGPDALAVIRRNEQVRRAIPNFDRFRPEPATGFASPKDYVAQLLPVRSSDPKDPCHADRCAAVLFRTPRGYLVVGATVDLTKRTAELSGEGRK